jgi:hypothetical protein
VEIDRSRRMIRPRTPRSRPSAQRPRRPATTG